MSIRFLLMAAMQANTATTTWDPAFKASTIALSNGNLTATGSGTNVAQMVRSTTSRSSGKVYWEVTGNTITNTFNVGFGPSSAPTSSELGIDSNITVGFFPGASGFQGVHLNFASLSSGSTISTSGDIISIALDITNKLLWVSDASMRSASTPWNNSVVANPSTNTGGLSLSTLSAGPYYAMFSAYENGGAATANFGATAFSQTVPTGFSAWG